jgi:hypothetical protein
MGQSIRRGAITYEAEGTFGEDTDTTATLRLSVLGTVDASGLKHDKVDSDRVTQRRNETTPWILATMGGTFKTRIYLFGHGADTDGAVTANGHETLDGYVFGNVAVSSSSGTTGSGGSATSITTAAASGITAGSIVRVGALNDGRGGGQCAVVSAHAGNAATLLTAIGAACTGTDAVGSGTMIYNSEAPTTTTVTGLRFLLQTANMQYLAHGCVCTNVEYSDFNPKTIPWREYTWECAWWEYKASTFPNTTATETYQPAPIASGSLFMNTVGTATRVAYTYRSFKLNYKLGIELLHGPGGVNQYQTLRGAVRTPDEITLDFVTDADAATITPTIPDIATSTNQQHILLTLNPVETKCVAFYWPNVFTNSVPIQMQDGNINRFRYTGVAGTGTTTTTDLTCSAQRTYFG